MKAAVILAAGRGTRMDSARPKVLHELAGRPLVEWVRRAVTPLVSRVVVVVGHRAEEVRAALAGHGVRTVLQDPQEGTGHALACAAPELEGLRTLLVLAGDVPLVSTETLAALVAEHEARRAVASVVTFLAADPAGYGRVLRDATGAVEAIVEHAEADAEQRRVAEVNSGTWAFAAELVLPLLPELPRTAKGEYYLTDVVSLLRRRGFPVAACPAPEEEMLGINTPEQLREAEAVLRSRDAEA